MLWRLLPSARYQQEGGRRENATSPSLLTPSCYGLRITYECVMTIHTSGRRRDRDFPWLNAFQEPHDCRPQWELAAYPRRLDRKAQGCNSADISGTSLNLSYHVGSLKTLKLSPNLSLHCSTGTNTRTMLHTNFNDMVGVFKAAFNMQK